MNIVGTPADIHGVKLQWQIPSVVESSVHKHQPCGKRRSTMERNEKREKEKKHE